MAETEEFAHGYHYGDYGGVVFYGAPPDGRIRLAVSDAYMSPLFRGILDQAWRDSGGDQLSQIVSDWNTVTGWADVHTEPVEVSPRHAAEFAGALARLTATDLEMHCSGRVEDCLRCAAVIREFIEERLARGEPLLIEDD